jgi:coproporphyrinogen III oxidase
MSKQRKKQSMQDYKNVSHYDPKIHTKTKGGYGFGMKKGAKEEQYESSGVNLASVFGWEVPDNLKHIKEAIDKRNGK